jgi:hypothetical protein
MRVNGILLAIIEVSLFFIPTFIIKKYSTRLHNMKFIPFFWICFTILTGIWEFNFITNYKKTRVHSIQLLKNHSHVWTNHYDLSNLVPSRFSQIFYSEYGAYADRLYMAPMGIWCRIIESSHALFCGLFALYAMWYYTINKKQFSNKFILTMAISMGSQLMNSLLYMGEYFIQTTDPQSVNYNTTNFPTGKLLIKRPFMWINIFWTIMPAYIIYHYLFNCD